MNYLAAVVMIGLLVFIHEFGHFVVAKLCGVHVTVFSFGFGRRLMGFKWRGTDYRVSALPFGGYVRMAGSDPFGYGDEDDDILEDASRAYLRRPVWQRLLVASAGPAFNLALPFVVFTVLLAAGEPKPDVEVGSVDLDRPAAEAGILPGDRIVSVEGIDVHTWGEVLSALHGLGPGSHRVVVDRSGLVLDLAITLTMQSIAEEDFGMSFQRPSATVGVDDPASPAGRAGIASGDTILRVDGERVGDWLDLNRVFATVGDQVELQVDGKAGERTLTLSRADGWLPFSAGRAIQPAEAWGLVPSTLIVEEVSGTLETEAGLLAGCRPDRENPPSPAALAGIQSGDRFLELGGRPVQTWNDVLNGVRATMVGEGKDATARAIDVAMVRAGRIVHIELTPMVIEDIDALGRYYFRPIVGVVGMGGLKMGPEVRVYYPIGTAFARAADETVQLGALILEQLGKLLTGEAAVQQSLGGPIEMVRQAGKAAEQGIFAWARLLGMLSISLGIVNLLPVPVLDGGQILFYVLEGIRGRPVSIALRERAQQVGVLFLVLLMLSVVMFDIHRAIESMGQ